MESDHKEANGMARRHACFMQNATHIKYNEPIDPEQALKLQTAILNGGVA